jgi:hypothetical protein
MVLWQDYFVSWLGLIISVAVVAGFGLNSLAKPPKTFFFFIVKG